MHEEPKAPVRLFSYDDDRPQIARGSLIPQTFHIDELKIEDTPHGKRISFRHLANVTVIPLASVAAIALLVFSGNNFATSLDQVAAAPAITLYNPYTESRSTLTTGPQPAFSRAIIFFETRDALIEERQTFLELDMPTRTVRFFEEGVLVSQDTAQRVGEAGSWWDAPSGLYEVATVKERYFSQYTQTYFPWAVSFEGNYLVHGWPQYQDGSPVNEEFDGGGVRLDNETAEQLYKRIRPGMTVIVRGLERPNTSEFTYEPAGPSVTANQYLVADIESATILTASGADERVSIASLTKLMAAVVAAEKLNFEQRVYAAAPTFVESLIPRLRQRSSVSVYSLLQLLLLESSNEAAEVLASTYGRDDFIKEMNNKARLLGMFDSNFADPSGLSSDNQSTPADLLKLARYIYNQRNFIFEITNRGEAAGVLGGGDFTGLVNLNNASGTEGFLGGKIGETQAAGQTSVSLHEVNFGDDTRVVAVIVLGSEARRADVATLLEFVSTNYNQ